MTDCEFCRIVNRETRAEVVYETGQCLRFFRPSLQLGVTPWSFRRPIFTGDVFWTRGRASREGEPFAGQRELRTEWPQPVATISARKLLGLTIN
jgi:hypothetical protein